MKITKFITFQMLQSENNGRQMMIQGLIAIGCFVYKCVKAKDHK
jgi:hypothetical protein